MHHPLYKTHQAHRTGPRMGRLAQPPDHPPGPLVWMDSPASTSKSALRGPEIGWWIWARFGVQIRHWLQQHTEAAQPTPHASRALRIRKLHRFRGMCLFTREHSHPHSHRCARHCLTPPTFTRTNSHTRAPTPQFSRGLCTQHLMAAHGRFSTGRERTHARKRVMPKSAHVLPSRQRRASNVPLQVLLDDAVAIRLSTPTKV